MKVRCKQTTAKGLDLKFVTTIISNDYDFNSGGYGIELNEEYVVMGITLYSDSNCYYYLIDTNGKPTWYPYLLFEIIDNRLPSNWFLKLYNPDTEIEITSILGFEELCNDEDFYDKLIERNDEVMRIYFKRKIELEKELEER